MNTAWFRHLKGDDEIEKFKGYIRGCAIGFDRLTVVLKEKKRSTRVTLKDYDNTDWPHKQAHLNGYNEALREVLKLINIKD